MRPFSHPSFTLRYPALTRTGKSIVKAAMDPVLPLRGTIVRTDATDKRSLILVNTLYHKVCCVHLV